MGGLSYFTTRHFLLAGREIGGPAPGLRQRRAWCAARSRTGDHAVRPRCWPTSTHGLRRPLGALPRLGKSYASSLSVGASSIPAALRQEVLAGNAPPRPTAPCGGHGRDRGRRCPIPSVQADYFEVFDLSDLDHTLRVLGLTLFVAGVVTTLLGVGLGRFASDTLAAPAGRRLAGGGGHRRRRARHPPRRRRGGPRPRGPDQVVQHHGRPAPGAHRARGPVQLRREPRAALAPDHAGGLPRGARGGAGPALRRARSGRCRCWATTCAASSAWWATCSRCRGPTPARRTSSSKRWTWPSWCSARSRPARGVWTASAGSRRPPCASTRPCEASRVGVDKRRFERVMVNLMENAAHYGGGVTEIAVDPRARTRQGRHGGGRRRRPGHRPGGARPRSSSASTAARPRADVAPGRARGLGLALVAEHMHVMNGGVRGRVVAGGRGPLRGHTARDRRRDLRRDG